MAIFDAVKERITRARLGASARPVSGARRVEPAPGWRSSRPARLVTGWLRKSWALLVVGVLAVTLAISAIVVPGTKAADLHLNDGTVYVPNRSLGLVGVLNYEIDELAAATSVGSDRFRIIQDGRTVLIHALSSNQLQLYDPITNSLGGPVPLPTDALVSLGNGILAVTNPNSGKVWYGAVETMLKTDFQRADAQLDVGEFGRAVVTASGQVIGLSVRDNQLIRPDNQAEPTLDLGFQLDAQVPGATDLSAVGEEAVILDRTSQQIWRQGDNNPTEITSGSTAFLAPPTASVAAAGSDARAIYSTQAGLNVLTNRGVRSASGLLNGTPVAPIVVGDCVYGANGDRVATVCGGGEPRLQQIPQLPNGADLAFVVNRGIVTLSDQNSGMVWLVDKDMRIVNNWDQVAPQTQTTNQGNRRSDNTTPPDRTQPNRPPVAEDDLSLGARAGRSTTLPVLDNDSDPDGDILSIEQPPEIEGATLQLTGNGSGLQITLPTDAAGTYSFTYRINDGRGGSDSATVHVTALSPDPQVSNQRPENFRPADVLQVAQGSSATKRVLLNWRDPDGDDLVLANAWLDPESEDEVRFTPDGTITFLDVGKTTGAKRVNVSVSDGLQSTDGVLLVESVARGVVAPIAYGDYVTIAANRDIVINPLANDEGTNLTLRSVDSEGGDVTITPNFSEGTFTFRAANPGTYYVVYRVSNGPVATGLVRINVISESGENHPPVAARDVALLPFGGSVVIDPLLNDTDPDGDVLVVQTVQTSDPAIQVVMEERHLLTISSTRMPNAPVTLTYWVSDGHASTRGTIVVMPSPSRGTQTPRAENDEVRVRAGATASVPVLRNDTSPIGLPLSLKTLVENPLGEGAWIDGDHVRLTVPANSPATTFAITYQITDSLGVPDSATVLVTVISADAENEAPRPVLTEARVLSGSTTRIPIKLDGIDPNGDAVRLLGLGAGPTLGRVLQIGDGWLTYESYVDSRGTDSFRYQVIDSLGAVGSAEVRIGVAPPSDDNTKPTAVRDELTVRPGRPIDLPVLRNDFDIDGDAFTLIREDPVSMPFSGVSVDERSKHVLMTAPTVADDYAGNYTIIDARQATATGSISIYVREDAPLLAPVALDDQVAISDVLGREWISVDVLENDYDLDGPKDALTISVPAPTDPAAPVTATVVDGKLRVNVSDAMQQVRYVITDADGNSAQAIVTVPGRNDSVPAVKDPNHVPTVVAGQTLALDINTLVAGTQGRQVKLTSVDTVRATKGVASMPGEDRITFVADLRYAGPASVVFEVIDVAPGDESSAKRAFVSIPITVTPAPDVTQGEDGPGPVANRAPEGPQNVSIEVGAGDPAVSMNIRGLFTDPEGDNFEFEDWRVEKPSDQITWTSDVGNGVVTASAGVKAKGATLGLVGRVFDSAGAGREVRVVITVIASLRPLPQAETDLVPDAAAGVTSVVPVLGNDRSNLLNDTTLTLLDASVVSGSGTAELRGDQVAVTPSSDYVGEMVVRYRIVDATGDADRSVDGQIRLTVRSRPGRPGTPVAEAVGNKFVRLKWTSGPDNGAPVIKIVVTARSETGDTRTKTDCASNLCTFDGLTNGILWTFTVVESNELGDSDVSPASAPARPDVKPEQASPPVAHHGDKQLGVTWTEPANEGSPINAYRLSIRGASAVEPVIIAAGDPAFAARSFTWTGLTNGVNYNFAIEAKNLTEEWSDISGWSTDEHPSGPPSPPLNVTGADVNGEVIRVTWAPPADLNGDPVTGYRVTLKSTSGLGDHTSEVGAGVNQADFGGLLSFNRTSYLPVVTAVTRGGSTDGVAPSAVYIKRPPTVLLDEAQIAGGDNHVRIVVPRAAPTGAEWDTLAVTLRFNGVTQAGVHYVAPWGIVSAPNGVRVSAYVQACVSLDTGDPRCNPVGVETNTVVPFGQLGAPGITMGDALDRSNARWVTVTPITNFNGVPPDVVKYYLVGNGLQPTEVSPNEPIQVDTQGAAVSLRAYGVDTRDNQPQGASATAVLSPPLTATKSTDNKITISMAGWPFRPSDPINCRMSFVEPVEGTLPAPDALGPYISVPVDANGNGSGSGGPYTIGTNATVTCAQGTASWKSLTVPVK